MTDFGALYLMMAVGDEHLHLFVELVDRAARPAPNAHSSLDICVHPAWRFFLHGWPLGRQEDTF